MACGRFAVGSLPQGAWTAPLALARAPARLGEAVALAAEWAAPRPVDPARLAAAIRQDLWRRLHAAPGLAPAALVRATPQGVSALAVAATLDRRRAASMTLDALGEIFHDAAVRQWTRWAAAA